MIVVVIVNVKPSVLLGDCRSVSQTILTYFFAYCNYIRLLLVKCHLGCALAV